MSAKAVNIDYVKKNPAVSLEALAAFYSLELKGSGTNGDQRTALCPFHDDHKRSLGLNVKKNIFQCFACGAKGNVIDFVMKMEEIDARQAAIRIAEVCGIDTCEPRTARGQRKPPAPTQTPAERLRAREDASEAAERAETPPETVNEPTEADAGVFTPYTRALPLDPEHPYLLGRGLDPETIATFELGYCKAGMQRGRIAIRIHDANGAPLGYVGRWAAPEPPEDRPKYLLPKNFPKHLVLFNLHRLPANLEAVTIVESFWSVFRLHELGIPALSPMGRSLSPEQVSLLLTRGIRNVTLLFDGDDAGRKGRETAIAELVRHLYVYAADVPDGFKPHKADQELLEALLR